MDNEAVDQPVRYWSGNRRVFSSSPVAEVPGYFLSTAKITLEQVLTPPHAQSARQRQLSHSDTSS